MNVTEIILLILGLLVFILSFILPARKKGKAEESYQLKEEQIKELIDREVEEAKKQIGDIVEETITYSMEKTERSMDRLTNEKMMAVNEFSDTVLEQIDKNHKEAVFLYDMLNDKHENLKTTVSEAVKTASEVKQTVKDAEITAREAEEKAREVQESLQAVELTEIESLRDIAEAQKEPDFDRVEETQSIEESVEFLPMNPLKVEIIGETEMKEPLWERQEAESKKTVPEKKEARKTKAEKIDLNLVAPGRLGGQNNNERILELHKEGKSNMAIAKELGLGIGEVKLVIDLFEGI